LPGYSNLEFDLAAGRRSRRDAHTARLLEGLLGAPAIAVNNNAAAVFLALNELASGGEVVVSRGELIEIGGSFRLPDIMRRAGAKLIEVGTTNRTHLEDYRQALGPRAALLLKVHTSNYAISGFTASVALEELVKLGRARGVPVAVDLGSGPPRSLSPTSPAGSSPRSPRCARRSRQAPISSPSAATSFSGDRRPASSWAAPI
jgi:L-seryl-tRNA(Ser) seleniumtransferase